MKQILGNPFCYHFQIRRTQNANLNIHRDGEKVERHLSVDEIGYWFYRNY